MWGNSKTSGHRCEFIGNNLVSVEDLKTVSHHCSMLDSLSTTLSRMTKPWPTTIYSDNVHRRKIPKLAESSPTSLSKVSTVIVRRPQLLNCDVGVDANNKPPATASTIKYGGSSSFSSRLCLHLSLNLDLSVFITFSLVILVPSRSFPSPYFVYPLSFLLSSHPLIGVDLTVPPPSCQLLLSPLLTSLWSLFPRLFPLLSHSFTLPLSLLLMILGSHSPSTSFTDPVSISLFLYFCSMVSILTNTLSVSSLFIFSHFFL